MDVCIVESFLLIVVNFFNMLYNYLEMWKYIILICLVISNTCFGESHKKIVIAVIDSGLNLEDERFSYLLCKEGHTDLTGYGIKDTVNHGTHVVGLIKQYAGLANYCIIILKYYNNDITPGSINQKNLISAIKKSIELKVDVVNISGGGTIFNEEENTLIKNNKDIKFIVASGNNGQNLDNTCNYYPCCYKYNNITCVGNLGNDHKRESMSNYGSCVKKWEIGEDVLSDVPISCDLYNNQCYNKKRMTGSSMSTAIYSGKLINEMSKTY